MLSSALQTRTSSPLQSANRIGSQTRDSSRIAYIVTDDEHLGIYFGAAIKACEIQVEWFRSASGYLAHKRPEVASCLLISQKLSDMSGLNLQRILARTFSPPIIFLSDDGDIPSCVRAIKGGADDFLTLPLMTSHLLEVMEAAFERDQSALVSRRENEDLRNRWRSLTSREAEVMRYVVDGFLNKQTAGELRITENTVQVHRGRVMRKMRADSLAALVCMALRLAECGEQSLLRVPSLRTWERQESTFHREGIATPSSGKI